MQDSRKQITFIINPVSGRRKGQNVEDLISAIIDSNRYDISVFYSEAEGHAAKLCIKALKNNSEIIVAVGGDGTINEVATQMIHTTSTLGIVPAGSGNGLARHLGIPLSLKKSLGLINKGVTTSIDTASINDSKFISIAGVGFDALIAEELRYISF